MAFLWELQNLHLIFFEEKAVKVCNLIQTSFGWLKVLNLCEYVIGINIKTCNRAIVVIVTTAYNRLNFTLLIHYYLAILVRIIVTIHKDCSTSAIADSPFGLIDERRHAITNDDGVTCYQTHGIFAYEVFSNRNGLSYAIGGVLCSV